MVSDGVFIFLRVVIEMWNYWKGSVLLVLVESGGGLFRLIYRRRPLYQKYTQHIGDFAGCKWLKGHRLCQSHLGTERKELRVGLRLLVGF